MINLKTLYGNQSGYIIIISRNGLFLFLLIMPVSFFFWCADFYWLHMCNLKSREMLSFVLSFFGMMPNTRLSLVIIGLDLRCVSWSASIYSSCSSFEKSFWLSIRAFGFLPLLDPLPSLSRVIWTSESANRSTDWFSDDWFRVSFLFLRSLDFIDYLDCCINILDRKSVV